jgi:D-3-phosphoglycerate dehydrogenase / 2-oxoglutarate reductase
MDNVILTPHLAWYTIEAFERVGNETLQSILEILKGNIPKNLKNPKVLEKLRKT